MSATTEVGANHEKNRCGSSWRPVNISSLAQVKAVTAVWTVIRNHVVFFFCVCVFNVLECVHMWRYAPNEASSRCKLKVRACVSMIRLSYPSHPPLPCPPPPVLKFELDSVMRNAQTKNWTKVEICYGRWWRCNRSRWVWWTRGISILSCTTRGWTIRSSPPTSKGELEKKKKKLDNDPG